MTSPATISAAPVSSAQPSPAALAAARAPCDSWEATMTSGRSRKRKTSFTSRKPPRPTQRTERRSEPRRITASELLLFDTLRAVAGRTDRRAASIRSSVLPELSDWDIIGKDDTSVQRRGTGNTEVSLIEQCLVIARRVTATRR
jgi:hypothetical protein